MTDKELLQQALEQLEHAMRYWDYRHIVDALRERLAQPEQEPLTEKRINELYSFWVVDCQDIVGFARAIERSKPQMQPCAGRNCGSTNPNLHSAECFEDYEKATGMSSVAHSIVAGALFDFMGWLTSRKERLVLSSTDEASPAAEVIKQFAVMRGLNINDAQVQEWQEHLAAPQPCPNCASLEAQNTELDRRLAEREWVGLASDERFALVTQYHNEPTRSVMDVLVDAEAKLQEKNHVG